MNKKDIKIIDGKETIIGTQVLIAIDYEKKNMKELLIKIKDEKTKDNNYNITNEDKDKILLFLLEKKLKD